ncbi:hypothetical protein NYF23_03895 [SAR92 clade bacterium H455]|jgi:hypothetical protein|uniref:HPt domain-containing protein n=1 Tax=SAR92 clade bacterium H455 TaxID=2974818 RepID=A0ABY5TQW9_9GAMM|nr:hypothetical protein NYF23_03895 [SAR92 clade bacterium H455]
MGIDLDNDFETERPEPPIHPIQQFDDDGRSLISCIDMLNRVSYFVDLLNHIEVGEDDNSGRDCGLSSHATTAYRNIITMLYQSLRFISASLSINEAEEFGRKSAGQASKCLDALNSVSDKLQELIDQSENEYDATDGASHFLDQLIQKLRSVQILLNEATVPLFEERKHSSDSDE